jgi:hypothetical protein
MKKLIPILIMLLLLPVVAQGATHYAKTIGGTVYYDSSALSCDDVTNGDTASDIDTFANSVLSSGDTGYVCAGTYSGTELDGDSTVGLPTNITLVGVGTVNFAASGDNDVLATTASGSEIQNINFTDDTGTTQTYLVSAAHNVTLTNCDFETVSDTAILHSSNTLTISGGSYSGNARYIDCNGGTLSVDDVTITSTGPTTDLIDVNAAGSTISVTNSIFTGDGSFSNGNDFLDLEDATTQTVTDCTFTAAPDMAINSEDATVASNFSDNYSTEGHGYCIFQTNAATGTHTIDGNRIINNLDTTGDEDPVGIRLNVTATVTNNIVAIIQSNGIDFGGSGSDGSLCYNNTVYGSVGNHAYAQQGGAQNTYFGNNIAYKRIGDTGQCLQINSAGNTGKQVYIDYNDWFVESGSSASLVTIIHAGGTNNYSSLAAWQAAVYAEADDLNGNADRDASSLNVNPNFINADGTEAENYTPMNAAVRAGTTGGSIPTTDYFGIKYDGIGAINDTRKLTILDD